MSDRIGTGTFALKKQTLSNDDNTNDPSVVVEIWTGSEAAYATFISGYDIGDAHGTYASLSLQDIKAEFEKNRGVVTMVYADATTAGSSNSPTPAPGTVVREFATTTRALPITSHPDWSGDWAEDKPGVEVFFEVQVQYIRTEYMSSFTWSQTNLIAGANKRYTAVQMTTNGLSGATTNAWLMVSKQGGEIANGITRKREVWQYNAELWDTDLFDAA